MERRGRRLRRTVGRRRTPARMEGTCGEPRPLLEARCYALRPDAIGAQLRARQDLLAIAAHELRTPMNALSLHLQTLERTARRQGHDAMVGELARANALLQRYLRRATVLLDVSRLTAGAFVVRRTTCNL